MKLTEKTITTQSHDYGDIVALMKRVFPKEELFPMCILLLLTKDRRCSFVSLYDSELFVGVVYTIEGKETQYIKYLAVNDAVHSNGYGSTILQLLKERYPSKPITLLIEIIDPSASNYAQRVRRLNFYKRNGLYQTGIHAGVIRPFVEILSTQEGLSKAQCRKMLKYLPLKLF